MNKSRLGLAALIIIAVLVPACAANPTAATDSPNAQSPSPGYKLYIGTEDGLMFSFEYPEAWRLTVKGGGYQNRVHLRIGSDPQDSQTESSVFIDSQLIPPELAIGEIESNYPNAHHLLYEQVWSEKFLQSLPDLIEGEINLGGVEGEEVSYSAKERASRLNLPDDKLLMIYRQAAVDYKGRIYSISYQLNTYYYENGDYEPAFDHLLETFRFLEKK